MSYKCFLKNNFIIWTYTYKFSISWPRHSCPGQEIYVLVRICMSWPRHLQVYLGQEILVQAKKYMSWPGYIYVLPCTYMFCPWHICPCQVLYALARPCVSRPRPTLSTCLSFSMPSAHVLYSPLANVAYVLHNLHLTVASWQYTSCWPSF